MSAKTTRRGGLTRREFLFRAAAVGGACAAGTLLEVSPAAGQDQAAGAGMAGVGIKANLSDHEVMFYQKLPGQKVRCGICPRECLVPEGQRGWCGVRENHNGSYRLLVYGKVVSAHIDPIEKKPLYHYLPGTTALSVATAGCNFECKFCQNWEISQVRPEQIPAADLPPAKLVKVAKARKVPTLAFTYNEPVIFYEYAHDAAKLARTAGIGSAMISNGFIREKPFRQLCEHLTAVKVDLKSFTDRFYRTICRGRLKPVLNTILTARKIGIHLELVVLVIPTLNDGDEELKNMAKWIVDNLGPDVPLHFSRFNPMYRLRNLPPTPLRTLQRAHQIARDAGVHYVYIGNVPMNPANHTYCHKCGKRVIKRLGFLVRENLLRDGKCPNCGTAIPGVWSQRQALARR